MSPGVFHSQSGSYAASSNLSKLSFKCSHSLLAIVAFVQLNMFWLWLFQFTYLPDFRVVTYPANSVLCFAQEKSLIFSLFRFFSYYKDRHDDFQAFLQVRVETENSRTLLCFIVFSVFSFSLFRIWPHWCRSELVKDCHVRSKDGIIVFYIKCYWEWGLWTDVLVDG